jgi:hypothetical protein
VKREVKRKVKRGVKREVTKKCVLALMQTLWIQNRPEMTFQDVGSER